MWVKQDNLGRPCSTSPVKPDSGQDMADLKLPDRGVKVVLLRECQTAHGRC